MEAEVAKHALEQSTRLAQTEARALEAKYLLEQSKVELEVRKVELELAGRRNMLEKKELEDSRCHDSKEADEGQERKTT
ncbi:hypothetical protein HDU99_010578, partial [Rhizoclosmatium hyalinum]